MALSQDLSEPLAPRGRWIAIGFVTTIALLLAATAANGAPSPATAPRARTTRGGHAAARALGASAAVSGTVLLPLLPLARPAPAWSETVVPAGTLEGVAYAAGRAYAVYQGQLQVIDMAEPARPRTVASVPAPSGTYQLAAAGSRLYALSPALLTVFDLADAARPVVAGSAPVALGQGYGGRPAIALYRHYVLVADNCRPLAVLDASRPDRITRVGEADQVGGSPVVLKDRVVLDYGHCSRGEATGLATVSLADPTHPRRVGGAPWQGRRVQDLGWLVDLPGGPYVAVVLRRGDGSSQVGVMEALPDGTFVERLWQELPRGALGAAADELGRVIVAYADGSDSHTEVATVGAGPSPAWTVLGQTATPAWRPVGAGDGVVAMRALSGGTLAALDIADPARPAPGGAVTLVNFRNAWLAAANGEHAFVITGSQGAPLVVLDARDAAGFGHRLGELGAGAGGMPTDMAAAGDFVYVLNRRWSSAVESLWAVDVADPARPRIAGELSGLVGRDLATDGRRLLVAVGAAGIDGQSGLKALSLADPAHPVPTGEVGGDFQSVALAGDLVVTGGPCATPPGSACLGTFSLAPDGALQPLGSLAVQENAWPYPAAVAVLGRRAYLLNTVDPRRAQLSTVDLGDPARPRLTRRQLLDVATPERLAALADGRLLASGGEQALIAVDALGAAMVAERFQVAGPADVVGGAAAFVAARDRGLWRLGPGAGP